MRKGFYLSSCSTCRRIRSEVSFPEDIEWIDLKIRSITVKELEEIRAKVTSYEALFSKRSLKFASVKELLIHEEAFKDHILKEYTFLKRPVIIYDDFVSVGSEKAVIESLKRKFNSV